MRFQAHRPTGPLASFVEYLWCSVSAVAVPVEGTQFPEGGVTLLFNMGPPQGLLEPETGNINWFRTRWAAGERARPYFLYAPGGSNLLGVHFRPGGAYPFLRLALDELTDRVVDLDSVWPRAGELHEQLASCSEVHARFRLLESELLARLARAMQPNHRIVASAVTELGTRGPGTSIGALARDLGVSQRHLLRTFAERVGIGPKTLHRVLRFQRIIRTVGLRRPQEWSRLAVRTGYFDQAHLIRDFRQFTALTPTEYLEQQSSDPNFAVG